jgi:hypothetical protein
MMEAALIALMMEAARTSETSVDIQLITRQYIPEDSELHPRIGSKVIIGGTQTDTHTHRLVI